MKFNQLYKCHLFEIEIINVDGDINKLNFSSKINVFGKELCLNVEHDMTECPDLTFKLSKFLEMSEYNVAHYKNRIVVE